MLVARLSETNITSTTTPSLAKPPSHTHDWRIWIAPFLWIVLNFVASSDLMSSGHTAVILTFTLNLLHIHLPAATVEHLNHILRKLGHFSAYAILGGLFFRSWRAAMPAWRRSWGTDPVTGNPIAIFREKLWTLRWSALAVASAALAAAFDEWHQSFVPSRTASPLDVALDTLGAVFLQLILMTMWINKESSE